MPTYRGNIGNLLQHWVLCELVERFNGYWPGLRFIDSYSMAPLATERPKTHWSSDLFDYARDRSSRDSVYERKWSELACDAPVYPNSAAFVANLWNGRFSMVLCELDPTTADELQQWKMTKEADPRCDGIEVAQGDWRRRFETDISGAPDHLLFLSFDPDMFSCSDDSRDGRKMTRSDLRRVLRALPTAGPLLVQLSTYSVNGGNSQQKVKTIVAADFEENGIQMVAVVKTDEQMMSMILARSCPNAFIKQVSELPERFQSWLYTLRVRSDLSEKGNATSYPASDSQRLPQLPRLRRNRGR